MAASRTRALGLAALVGCEQPTTTGPTAVPDRPNILVVTLDTTRADAFEPWGGPEGLTPTFARLTRQGVVFLHTYTVTPLTIPAHSSLFTGVSGNYLKGSIRRAGLDPDNLPAGDAAGMSFRDGAAKPKAWKEIWGAGQGVGGVTGVVPAADLVDRIGREYHAAYARMVALAPGAGGPS